MKFYKIVKILLRFFPLLGLVILLDPSIYPNYGEFAWRFLILLLFLRPIRDIFPEYKVLKLAVSLRKELGIISWVFWLAHVVWYFLVNKLPASFIFDSIMWNPYWYLWWGMFAFIASIILTLTSNIFSIKKMWKYWKPLQRLAYFMFFATAIHVALVKPEALISIIITLTSYVLVYILAYIYKK